MMKQMDISDLKAEAKIFCEFMKQENHTSLIGITDGKAVGTYIEHRFQKYLSSKYEIEIGNSAKGEYYELLEHCLGSLEQVKSKGWSRTEPAPIL